MSSGRTGRGASFSMTFPLAEHPRDAVGQKKPPRSPRARARASYPARPCRCSAARRPGCQGRERGTVGAQRLIRSHNTGRRRAASSSRKTRRLPPTELPDASGNYPSRILQLSPAAASASGRKSAYFFQEDRRIGHTEAVDRLLHVSDEEQIPPRAADRLKDRLLHGVRVLIFVDHQLKGSARRPRAPPQSASRRRDRTGAASRARDRCNPAGGGGSFFGAEALGKRLRQPQQSAQRRRTAPQIVERVGRGQAGSAPSA